MQMEYICIAIVKQSLYDRYTGKRSAEVPRLRRVKDLGAYGGN